MKNFKIPTPYQLQKHAQKKPILPIILFFSWSLLMVGLFVKVTFFQVVLVSGHSMSPTIHDSQKLLMLKTDTISRGDIVIAKEKDGTSVVKRAIGIPGDHIKITKDTLTINDKVIDEPYVLTYKTKLYNNTLDDLYKHLTSKESNDIDFYVKLAKTSAYFTTDKNGAVTFEVDVPKDSYYLLGDNRILSYDSRELGFFKTSDISGKVLF